MVDRPLKADHALVIDGDGNLCEVPIQRRSNWERWAGTIAFVLLLLIGTVGFYRVETNAYDGCVERNNVRAGLRASERELIAEREATDPDLFPTIPRAQFEKLVDESIDRAEFRIKHRYRALDCGSVWPLRG